MQLLERLRRVKRLCLTGDNFLRVGDGPGDRAGVHLFGNPVSATARYAAGTLVLGAGKRRENVAQLRTRTNTAGIAVAFWLSMRPFFLAWLTLALLLLVLGRFTVAGDELAIAGFLNATEQEAAEGYFAVGGDTMVVVKQGSGLQRWLNAHAGRRIRVTLSPDAE
jgi:hypothetical protein